MTTTETLSTERLHELDNAACDQLASDPDGLWDELSAADAHSILTELLNIRLNVHHEVHRCFIRGHQFKAGEMVLSDVNEGLGHRACFGDDREGYVKDLDTGEPLGPDDPIPAGEPYDPADYPEFARNAQSEAVAWRWRLTDSETWHTEKVDPSGRIGGAHIVVEPLYTHPAPQSEAVAVKAWQADTVKSLQRAIMDDDEAVRERACDEVSQLYAEAVAPYSAAIAMVREAIGEIFGPIASIESEDATLLRGPEPHHEAEAQIAALQRIRSALTHPAPPLAVTDEMVERLCFAAAKYAPALKGQYNRSLYTPAATALRSALRAALTAALEAKQ